MVKINRKIRKALEFINAKTVVSDYLLGKIQEHFGRNPFSSNIIRRSSYDDTNNEDFETNILILGDPIPNLFNSGDEGKTQVFSLTRNGKYVLPNDDTVTYVRLKPTARLNEVDFDSFVRKIHNIIVSGCTYLLREFQKIDPSIVSCSIFSTNPDVEPRPFCSFCVKNPLYVVGDESPKVDCSTISFTIFPTTRTIECTVFFRRENASAKKEYSLKYDDTFRVTEKINSILNRIEEERLKFYGYISKDGLEIMKLQSKVTRMYHPRTIMRELVFGNIIGNTWLEMHSQSQTEYVLLLFDNNSLFRSRDVTVVNRISDSNIPRLSTQINEEFKKMRKESLEIEQECYSLANKINNKIKELFGNEKFEEENRRLNEFLRPRLMLFLWKEMRERHIIKTDLNIFKNWSDIADFMNMYEVPFFFFSFYGTTFYGTNDGGIFYVKVDVGFENPTSCIFIDFFLDKNNQFTDSTRIAKDSKFETNYRENEERSVSAFCRKYELSPREFLDAFKRDQKSTGLLLFEFMKKNLENENVKSMVEDIYRKIKMKSMECSEIRSLYDEYEKKERVVRTITNDKKVSHIILDRMCGDKTVRECGSIEELILICNYYLGTGVTLERVYDIFPENISR